MTDAFQAQARICPTCFDDHEATTPCAVEDLVERVGVLDEKLATLRIEVARYVQNPGCNRHARASALGRLTWAHRQAEP